MSLGQKSYKHVSGHGESAPDIILGPDGMLLSGVIGTRVVSPDLFNTLYCNMLNPGHILPRDQLVVVSLNCLNAGTWEHPLHFYQNSLRAWIIHMHPKAVAGIVAEKDAETKCPFPFCTTAIDNQGVESKVRKVLLAYSCISGDCRVNLQRALKNYWLLQVMKRTNQALSEFEIHKIGGLL